MAVVQPQEINAAWQQRLAVLTSGPVLETRDGCRARISVLMEHSPIEFMRLCEHYHCGPDDLERRLHRPLRPRRRKRQEQMTFFSC